MIGVSKDDEKIECNVCNGSGLERREIKKCKECNGRICMRCADKGGLVVSPYETCRKCYGDGVIHEHEMAKN